MDRGAYLGDILEIIWVWKVGIQGDGSGLDSDASLLFVLSCIGESAIDLSTAIASMRGRGKTYASPALAAEMIPARWTRESVKVDLPWSTGNEVSLGSSLIVKTARNSTYHGQ